MAAYEEAETWRHGEKGVTHLQAKEPWGLEEREEAGTGPQSCEDKPPLQSHPAGVSLCRQPWETQTSGQKPWGHFPSFRYTPAQSVPKFPTCTICSLNQAEPRSPTGTAPPPLLDFNNGLLTGSLFLPHPPVCSP